MKNLFNSIRVQRPGRNIFNLSHQVKMTMNMGKLVPFICDEVVPGDKFRVSSDVMIRFAPMLAPVMHHVNVYCHYFLFLIVFCGINGKTLLLVALTVLLILFIQCFRFLELNLLNILLLAPYKLFRITCC